MANINSRLREVPDAFTPGYLAALDKRTTVAAQMHARWAAITDDMGGEDGLSYVQKSLIERALWLEFWIAAQERTLAEGGEVDMGRLTQAGNALLGLFRTIGIERRAKDVTSLSDYLRKRASVPAMPGAGQ